MQYGSRHTDCIVTTDAATARRFQSQVDAAGEQASARGSRAADSALLASRKSTPPVTRPPSSDPPPAPRTARPTRTAHALHGHVRPPVAQLRHGPHATTPTSREADGRLVPFNHGNAGYGSLVPDSPAA